MKRINVSGTYSFDEVLQVANNVADRVNAGQITAVSVGDLIEIVNELADDQDVEKAVEQPRKRRGRPRGSKNKPEGKKAEEEKDAALTAGSGSTPPVGASAVAGGEDEYEGI